MFRLFIKGCLCVEDSSFNSVSVLNLVDLAATGRGCFMGSLNLEELVFDAAGVEYMERSLRQMMEDHCLRLAKIKEMLEKGLEPDIITYSMLMDGLCHSMKVEMALKLWRLVLREGLKADVTMHNIIIHGLSSDGKPEDAFQLFLNTRH
ncbi:hypothetical protein Droror1_Dr00018222 [Drosera rotundifolia]